MAVDEDVPLDNPAVLRIEHVANNSWNRRIHVRDVVSVHATGINRMTDVVLIKLNRYTTVGNDVSGQVDVEYETLPHV
jgi:hypothetical protein